MGILRKITGMTLKHLACMGIGVTLAASIAGCATKESRQTSLQKQARVSRADAEQLVLAKVPGGSVKEGELEKEHGKLIWSFDIATPGTSDITEVHVDAISGQVLGTEIESAGKEASEKAHDKKKEKDDDDKNEKK
jgi:hypothetical protein